ncbi:hypothetical protein [Sporosarcina newyorkensis]|uniref:hypothetical protein n=1 Tax=Sporosarcina newyorkensis TaxID=759851 RepID=UPI003CFFC0C4
MKRKEIRTISQKPINYFGAKAKGLEERLEGVVVDKQTENQIMKDKTTKVILDKSLGLFGGVGDVISTIINWGDEVDNDLKEAKKAALLEQYFNKVDDIDSATTSLTNLLTNPHGYTIYSKIIRILDDYPPDVDLMEHLSRALKHIIDEGNFKKLFDSHKFALSQIEVLSPQSLSILSDFKNWPKFDLKNSVFMNGKLETRWHEAFAVTYCREKGISDNDIVHRITHSITELDRLSVLEVSDQGQGKYQINLTTIGTQLAQYIS